MKKLLNISASSLGLFKECPRCFYLQIKEKIHRPSGPFPSLPGGMDGLIKKYFDKYRSLSKLPPAIDGKVKGKLLDNFQLLEKWRNWRQGLKIEDEDLGVQLVGALDDCLMGDDGKFIPLDYKTRGYALKEGAPEYYLHQLDIYSYLLDENGYPTNNLAYLVYFHPIDFGDDGMAKFEITVQEKNVDKDRGKKLFYDAAILLQGPIPPKHTECQFCSWSSLEV